MKVIVFGGSGFLGSHVADILTDRGHQVTIFDRVKSPYLQKSQSMIVADALDPKVVAQAVREMDIVYNFIAQPDIEHSADHPRRTIELNILSNVNILEAACQAKVKRFVFSSTVYVYSDMGSFYRSSKQACELLIQNYQEEFDLEYTILRYGSLYGPRSTENNWLHKTLKQALIEGKITREGNGEEIREYIHVYDAARLSVDILDDQYKNRSFLLTGNEQLKIKEILGMIREMFKGNVEIQYLPAKEHSHYTITPYVFNPQMATKLKSNEHIDIGQGLLNILTDLHKEYVHAQSA
ncbi:MAG: NAD(P)-dependent oxidoreductase [Candidatus Omnitrophica bacterium]|nr:NAD(P)-dependent oxidoreductase [Candidatus Omnitrophota bacterium]